jgi:hypothetical protein
VGECGPDHVDYPLKYNTINFYTLLSLNNYKIVNKEDIKAAIAKIELFKDFNYYKITYNYKLIYIKSKTYLRVNF